MMTDSKADVVADDRTGRRSYHYSYDIELIRSTGSEISGDQKNRFTRHRHAGVFQHYAEEHCPVAISEHVLLDQLKRVVQEIHGAADSKSSATEPRSRIIDPVATARGSVMAVAQQAWHGQSRGIRM